MRRRAPSSRSSTLCGGGRRPGGCVQVPAERIALACWGIAHGLVSLELAGIVPPGLDVADGYEDALRAMINGWSVNRPS